MVDKKIYECKPEERGGTLLVAQLLATPRCKPEGRGFDWCHWNFSLT